MNTRILFVLVAFAATLLAQGTITSTAPSSVQAGVPSFLMAVNGSGFASTNLVQWDGGNLATTFVSGTQLAATVTASLVALGGSHNIRVKQSPLVNNFSNTVTFDVNNPVPTITTFGPGFVAVGSGPVTLDIQGTHFVTASIVKAGGVNLSTTFLSATHIQGTVPASMTAIAASLQVQVFNAAPGGGTATSGLLLVQNPVPTLGSINPTSTTAGIAGLTLIANGTNYNSSTIVLFGNAALTTTLVNSTQVTAQVTASQLATGGTHPITIDAPPPGGGTTTSLTLTVNNPVPTLASISPASTVAGNQFGLTATGTGYTPATVVKLDGIALATAFVDSTQVMGVVPGSLIPPGATHTVTVSNPAPAGGTSGGQTLTVTNPVPTMNAISPTTVTVGSAGFTLTVTGTGCIGATAITFDSAPLATTLINQTHVSATVPAALVASAGTHAIRIENPIPGGGTSSALTLTVQNPVPSIGVLSPSSTTANAPPPSFTVIGSGFVPACQILFDGNALATAFVSSSALSATVPAGAMSPAGVHQVSVTTPGPGGGTSNSVPFTVGNPVPVISSLSPVLIPGGGSDVLLTMTGAQFMFSATVDASGVPISSTTTSSSGIDLVFPASLQRATRDFTITVTNPGPGGGSASIPFTVDGPAVSSSAPVVVPVMTGGSPPITFTVNGGTFHAGDQIRINGAPRPTTFVNALTLSCSLDGSFPVLLQPGGFAVTVTRQGSFSLVASNALGVPVGIVGTPDNAGTVTLAPAPPAPGQGFNLRVELPVANVPVTLLAQVPAPTTVLLSIAPGFDLVVGPGLNSPIILTDGLGLFGPPTATFATPYGLSSFGIPAGHGVFEIRDLGAPLAPIGITFSLAAVYVDPTSLIGLNATHVGGPYSL